MPTMAAMMMMTTMRTVAAPDLSRPHDRCCRYRLAVRPLDPPPYPHSAANYRPLNHEGGSGFGP